jgi:hypothetical protein
MLASILVALPPAPPCGAAFFLLRALLAAAFLLRGCAQEWEVTTIAGNGTGFSDGVSAGASFNRPSGVALLGSSLYVADTGNNLLREVSLGGVVVTLAGSAGGFLDAVGTNALFSAPFGVTVDSASGAVVVSDWGNYRIRKMATDGVVTTLAGSVAGFADSATTTSFTFVDTTITSGVPAPFYIATNGDGSVLLATNWNVAGSAVTVSLDGGATFGITTDDANHIFETAQVSTDGTRFFVCPFRASPCQYGTLSGSSVFWALSSPDPLGGSTAGMGSFASAASHDLATVFLNVVAFGDPGLYKSTDYGATFAPVASPPSVQINQVACSSTCSTVLAATTTMRETCNPPSPCPFTVYPFQPWQLYISTDTGASWGPPIDLNSIGMPTDSAVSGSGAVMAASLANVGVYVSTDGGGSWTLKTPGDLSPQPWWGNVDVSSDGAVIVAVPYSGNGAVPAPPYISTDSGATWAVLGAVGASTYYDATLSRDGRVWYGTVASNDVKRVVISTTTAPSGGTGTSAQFNQTYGVAVDAGGSVVVADALNHRIRAVTPGGVVSTLAGSTAGFLDATGASAQFSRPFGVAVDAGGTVAVADRDNHRIRKVTPGGVVTTLAGSGSASFADGSGASASFNAPTGVAFDAGGNVVVADYSNHRIRIIAPSGAVRTLAGGGVGAFANGVGTSAALHAPFGVAVSAAGLIFVADSGNNRIRQLSPVSSSLTPTPSGTPTVTPTATRSGTLSPSPSAPATPPASPTGTATPPATPSLTPTSSGTPSSTPTPSLTPTASGSPSSTPFPVTSALFTTAVSGLPPSSIRGAALTPPALAALASALSSAAAAVCAPGASCSASVASVKDATMGASFYADGARALSAPPLSLAVAFTVTGSAPAGIPAAVLSPTFASALAAALSSPGGLPGAIAGAVAPSARAGTLRNITDVPTWDSQTALFRHDFEADAEGWDAAPVAGRGGVGPLPAPATGRGTLLVALPPFAPLFDPANGTADPLTSAPFIDGPFFTAPFTDGTYVVLRMRHLLGGSGGGAHAALGFRNGAPGVDASAAAHAAAHVWLPAPTSWWRPFPVVADGGWHTYAVPVAPGGLRLPAPDAAYAFSQLRLHPLLLPAAGVGGAPPVVAPAGAVEVDFILAAHAPIVLRVEGCGARGRHGPPPTAPVRPPFRPILRPPYALNRYALSAAAAFSPTPGGGGGGVGDPATGAWAFTYGCARGGGEALTVSGLHFGGPALPRVWVAGAPCANVSWASGAGGGRGWAAVTCTSPPCAGRACEGAAEVALANGGAPLLSDTKPLLFFAAPPPPPPAPPTVTNVAATALTLAWPQPAHAAWAEAMTITGYVVQWRGALVGDGGGEWGGSPGADGTPWGGAAAATGSGWVAPATPTSGAPNRGASLGTTSLSAAAEGGAGGTVWGPWGRAPGGGEAVTPNATAATLRGFAPGGAYQFRVAAVAEAGEAGVACAWGAGGDAHGVRAGGHGLCDGALVGAFSRPSPPVSTLFYDVLFTHFDANATLDWGPAAGGSSHTGVGWAGGEGHYGLVLVGSAHLGNGNDSHVCCDGYGGRAFPDAARWAVNSSGGTRSGAPGVGWADSVGAASPEDAAAPAPHLWRFSPASLSWAALSPRGPWAEARGTADGLNVGTVGSVAARSRGRDAAAASAASAAAAVEDMAVERGWGAGERAPAGGLPILTPARGATLDLLLGRALGAWGGWAAGGTAGGAGPLPAGTLWDEYDDAGALVLVPERLYAALVNASAGAAEVDAALGALDAARRGGGASGAGIAWAGTWGDPRVDPAEAGKGPLDPLTGAPGPAPAYPFTPLGNYEYLPAVARRALAEVAAARSGAGAGGRARRAAGSASAPQVPGFGPDAIVTPSPSPPPAPAYVDGRGRTLLPWPFDPVNACTLVGASAAAFPARPAVDLRVLREGGGVGGASYPGPLAAGLRGPPESGAFDAVGGAGAPPPVDDPVTGRATPAAPPPWAPAASHRQPRPASSPGEPFFVVPAAAAAALSRNASAPCGPALRLTPSRGSAAGAAWYGRALEVRGGFDTTFIFRAANPSPHCRAGGDWATRCASRGGGGLAFVLQTASPAALGNGSSGLGYGGLLPALAVEFDTWADAALGDPGDNHVAVMARGPHAGGGASPNHTFALGEAPLARDLTGGLRAARVVYSPRALARAPALARHPSFSALPHAAALAAGAPGGGAGWAGALSVFLDGDEEPALIVPCDAEQLLGLADTHGRAWVGFTAATGADVWQQHDVMGWHWVSLRE